LSPFRPGFGTSQIIGTANSGGIPIAKFTMGHGQSGILEGDWLMLGNWSGGVRVSDAPFVNGVLQDVTFINNTWTVLSGGFWNFAIQIQGAKPTEGSQLRNWAWAARKNVATTTVNQATTPIPFSSVITFDTSDQILTTVGVTSFVMAPGDTVRLFAMESLPFTGTLQDVEVFTMWLLAQKFIT
jgi:hypothetical protein